MTGGSLLVVGGLINIGNEPATCQLGTQERVGLPERQAHRARAAGSGRLRRALYCGTACDDGATRRVKFRLHNTN